MKNRGWTIAGALVVGFLSVPLAVFAGNGRFNQQTGEFDFCVCVRPQSSGENVDLAPIRQAFAEAGEIIKTATSSQHQFGTVSIVKDCEDSNTAEFWVHPGAGHADAAIGMYGKRGQHANLYFDNYFTGADPLARIAIAHEFAHQAYGLWDEYVGAKGEPAECAEQSSANYCLMDDFRSRSLGPFPLFCTPGAPRPHDPDHDTLQSVALHQSCWETINEKYPTRVIPLQVSRSARAAYRTTLASDDCAPGSTIVIFLPNWPGFDVEVRGEPRSLWNFELGKEVALLFANFADATDRIGALLYPGTNGLTADSYGDQLPPACINPDRPNPLVEFINRTTCDCCPHPGTPRVGDTCIPYPHLIDSLQHSYDLLKESGTSLCDSTILYISLGDDVPPPADDLAMGDLEKELKDHGVRVLSVAIGNPIVPGNPILSPSEYWLRRLADETGGDYFPVENEFSLLRLFAHLLYQNVAGALLGHDPGSADQHEEDILTVGAHDVKDKHFFVEDGASSLTVATIIERPDPGVTLALYKPSGNAQGPGDLISPNANGVRFSGTDRSQIYRIANPSPGTWTARVQNTSAAENRFTVIETATHNGTQLAVTVDDATIQSPDPITFHATPLFDGRNVTGATVSGQITRPDGTVATISFSDGGLGADEEGPDVIANDGIYMARMHASDYTGDGVYEIRVTAINQGQGRTYEGEPIEAAVAPRAVQINVPAFSRTAMASFEVRGKCPGDCNMNRETTIDELLTGVNLSLGSEATSRCATLDIDYSGDVTVDELIRAVIAALEGCR